MVLARNLKNGMSQSCGCRAADMNRASHFIDGRCGTKEYRQFQGMLKRCSSKEKNPRIKKNYFERGIRVCNRWKDFALFLADMGKCPKGLTLDRINNDGNYEPGNCRWATRTVQARNTRSNVLVTHNGRTLCVAEWSEITGISRYNIGYRLHRGWPAAIALNPAISPGQARTLGKVLKRQRASCHEPKTTNAPTGA